MSEKYIKYTSDNFTYDKILKPKVTIGLPLSKEKYDTDSEGNLLSQPDPLVNALDINWGGASVLENKPINTTDDLLYTIDQINKNSGGDSSPIIGLMMQAIRALQAEVVKLRNSFTYGIYSYKDKQTAMSNILGEYTAEELGVEEPLWAVDEDTLSELLSVNLSSFNEFDPQDNITLNIQNNSLIFNGSSTWTDEDGILSQVVDPKVYVYFTSTGLNITLHLKEKVEEGQDAKTLDINLKDLFNFNKSGKAYNILFILSTKVEQNKELKGQNFCWIQVGHYILDENIQQGYYNKETKKIQDTFIGFGDERYYIDSITFNDLELSKFNFYSKYQNFANEVESTNPIYQDRYKAAHITIRSIDTYENLVDIKDQLPENELIYVENGKGTLYIKNDYKLKKIGAGGDEPGPEPQPDTMTNKELLEALRKMGIVYENYHEDPDTQDYVLDLAALDSVTFIHQASGKMFDISVDAYGKLKSMEKDDESLSKELDKLFQSTSEQVNPERNNPFKNAAYTGPNNNGTGYDIRGFNAHLNLALSKNSGSYDFYKELANGDFKLNSDRIRIASIYAPFTTDNIYGCSHGFLELENSGDKDFYLDGCVLYYTDQDKIYSLELTGKVPANGTYLIRCKQFADPKYSPNVYITVDTYDIEWWIDTENGKELLDTSLDTSKVISYAIVHLDDTLTTLTKDTKLYLSITENLLSNIKYNINGNIDINKLAYCYDPHLVDAITLNGSTSSNWAVNNFKTLKSNSIYKNTFELDPAKQAYNGFNMYESSRVRWNKPGTDSQTLELNKEYIEFPKTKEIKYVKDYTPKASFECKNVCTDKTQLDMEKPNMPTVSFGIDIFTTRCFNWISCGLYDEYVFIKTEENKWKKFESYKSVDSIDKMPAEATTYPRRYEYTNKDIQNGFNSLDINNSTYARFTFNLPANGTQVTSHKCIIEFGDSTYSVENPTEFTYVVGRADKNGNPDFNHCSKELHFTIYPKSYIPRIYQITDQQGFHWIEYQVWGAAALKVLEKINADQQQENIIPILINTGDAVQAGCRINEWLDYYIGGECLFDHLEQMEIVGNNDLCGTDYTLLGTGDDEGKSNSFFYSLFYCYQMDPSIPTLIRGLNNNEIKYIPSLYYFEYNGENNNKLRFVNINSEITYVNSKDWFDLKLSDNYIINPYNGYCLSNNTDYKTHIYCIDGQEYHLDNGSSVAATVISGINMVSIYELIYKMLQCDVQDDNTKYVVACHEMPFTVITHANMKTDAVNKYRSASGSSLVGSHLNQLIASESGPGTYWFSRLLEHKGVKLCIGGHKHTYCYTYPLREYYEYDNNSKNSLDNGPMTMGQNLKNDDISWTSSKNFIDSTDGHGLIVKTSEDTGQYTSVNLSKLPITNRTLASMETINPEAGYFVPTTLAPNEDNNTFVTYFMCQATGYKLTSNKELPTPIQAFTKVLPKTNPGADSDTPNANQKYPMFGIISFDFNENLIHIKNARIAEIYLRAKGSKGEDASDPYKATFNFNQQKYSQDDMYIQYLVDINYYNSLYYQKISENEYSYGNHLTKLDKYNLNDNKDITYNCTEYPERELNFNNYGIWTSEETNIDEPIRF